MKSLLLFATLVVFVAAKAMPDNNELVLKRTRRAVNYLCKEGCEGDTCYRGLDRTTILPFDGRLTSKNGKYYMVMQRDGNLVIYCGKQWIWATRTYNRKIKHGLHMQGDGNLVLYTTDGKPIWNSKTYNIEVDRFVLENDGRLVGYGKYGKVFWSSDIVNKCPV